MTSKALEAAVSQISLALFTANDELRAALYEVEQSDDAAILDRTRRVIRAFAQNISEEAAEAGSNAAAQTLIESARSGQTDLNAAERAGIIAAIERDLE